jgi:hypothetical protein
MMSATSSPVTAAVYGAFQTWYFCSSLRSYGFSSLLKQNKKAKICFVIYIAGFFFKFFFCYEVFAKQKKAKLLVNNYSCVFIQAPARSLCVSLTVRVCVSRLVTSDCSLFHVPSSAG